MNKGLLVLTFLFTSCSSDYFKSRLPASQRGEEKVEMKLLLNRTEVFANGADSVLLKVKFFKKGEAILVDPKDLKILGDKEFEQTDFKLKDESYEVLVRPRSFSGDLRLLVAYQENFISEEVKIKTYLTPVKEKMSVVPWQPTHSVYVSGHWQKRDHNASEEHYAGFTITNDGNNHIVNTNVAKYSSRSFDFSNEQNAAQNMSFLVVDAPNEITSHGMYSQFMLFPRIFLPQVRLTSDKLTEVTLSTGEVVTFNYQGGYITSGVFEEGPVDISGDRFKRRYPDLKYKGKGILLRANARGQMPQQGQFENTKIDLNHGAAGSAEVLIINGSTGERCRRPKIDFWSSADVNPILFKFPTDREFDAYLRAKCKFGIPELEIDPAREKEDAKVLALGVWEACLSPSGGESSKVNYLLNLKHDFLRPDIRECLNEKIGLIADQETLREVAYEAYTLYQKDRKTELKELGAIVAKHEKSLVVSLYRNSEWIKDSSLKSLESECKLEARKTELQAMKFYDAKRDLDYAKICQEIKSKLEEHLEKSISVISKKFLNSPENFKQVSKISKFTPECITISNGFIDKSFDLFPNKSLYSEVISQACDEIKSSEEYREWLISSEDAMVEEILNMSYPKQEELAYQKASSCLVDFPNNNTINRIRFKAKRESCLRDAWPGIQRQAVLDSFKANEYEINEKLIATILEKLQEEGRRLQIKVMKDKF